jgi:hypothetical protein
VVPELTEHPAEDDTKSWQGAVDVGVRVRLKMVGQRGFEVGDLSVERRDDLHHSCRGGSEGRGYCRPRGEVLTAHHDFYPGGA